MHEPGVRTRRRRDADLPTLAEVLAAQQPVSGYPQGWPLPWPVEQFLVRAEEHASWVAEVDGRVVGHIAVTGPGTGPEVDGWLLGTGRPLAELDVVSVLFVDHTLAGSGVGSALLRTAVGFIRSRGHVPVLDVVQESGDAVAFYRRRGWVGLGEARPSWLPDTSRPVLLMMLPD